MKRHELQYVSLSILMAAVICGLKFYAFAVSRSVVVLSDALESIINIVAGFFAFYSIYLSGQPRDANHPYGHGKIEFFSIGFEGGMIAIAGGAILYSAALHYLHPEALQDLHKALWLVALTAALNGALGWLLIRQGRRRQSLTLQGNGRHILSDSYSGVGILAAVTLISLTGWNWVDILSSVVVGIVILISGFRLLRKSVSGLMDETDLEVIDEILEILAAHRQEDWIDVHNMRVQRFGTYYHVDCHLTLPYYYTLDKAHELITAFGNVVNASFRRGEIEFFIHGDPCVPDCCHYCHMPRCPVRQEVFDGEIAWTRQNALPNRKHFQDEFSAPAS